MDEHKGEEVTVFSVTEDIYGVVLDPAETLVGFIVDDDEPAVIEPGTAKGVPRLIAGLESVGIAPEQLQHIVVGHYHIDHSGGVPGVLETAPEANWYLHESMAEWLIDDEKFERFVASSVESLGVQFEAMGAPAGPPDERRLVTLDDDGTDLETGTYTLQLIHTPGHTPDHLSVGIPEADVLMANEALGRYFPKTDAFHPPVTVPVFDIDATRESIEKLADPRWEQIAFTHAGIREDPTAVFETARSQLERFLTRIPDLYDDHDEDLGATIEAVRQELLNLDAGYPAAIAKSQATVCTEGVLQSLDRL